MLKVKVFDCEHENDLTNEINDFIKEISNKDKEVIDIKYSTSISINDDEMSKYEGCPRQWDCSECLLFGIGLYLESKKGV